MRKEKLIYDVNGQGALSSYTVSVRKLKLWLHRDFGISFRDMRFALISN